VEDKQVNALMVKLYHQLHQAYAQTTDPEVLLIQWQVFSGAWNRVWIALGPHVPESMQLAYTTLFSLWVCANRIVANRGKISAMVLMFSFKYQFRFTDTKMKDLLGIK
jgi:hypothetical protein